MADQPWAEFVIATKNLEDAWWKDLLPNFDDFQNCVGSERTR